MINTVKRTFTSGDGVMLVGEEYGPPQGHPVILFHGGGQTRHAWRRSALKVCEHGFRVVVVDMRGHGESGWADPNRYELDDFAADVMVVSRPYGEPVLVGASLGGIAALTAIGESDVPLASALVLVDIVTRPDPAGVQRVREFMRSGLQGFSSLDEVAEAIAVYLPHRTRPASHDGLLKNLRRGNDGKWLWHWDPAFFERVDQGPGEPSAGSFTPPDRLDRAARRVKIPTLLVRGGASDVVSDEGVKGLRDLIPHARSVLVPGAGHMVAGDENARFMEAVIEFVTQGCSSDDAAQRG